MKAFGRFLAALVAGVLSVLAVQQVIRRIYAVFGKRYYELRTREGEDHTPKKE